MMRWSPDEPDDKYSEPFQPLPPWPYEDEDEDNVPYEDDDWMSDLDDEEGDTAWGA